MPELEKQQYTISNPYPISDRWKVYYAETEGQRAFAIANTSNQIYGFYQGAGMPLEEISEFDCKAVAKWMSQYSEFSFHSFQSVLKNVKRIES
jgi:hypothetical protein